MVCVGTVPVLIRRKTVDFAMFIAKARNQIFVRRQSGVSLTCLMSTFTRFLPTLLVSFEDTTNNVPVLTNYLHCFQMHKIVLLDLLNKITACFKYPYLSFPSLLSFKSHSVMI